MNIKNNQYKLASLFAGIGGIDLGFKQAGFDSVWANDIDEKCAITYKLNNPNVHFELKNINCINSKEIPKIDVLTGGFPCQPFSIAGKRKGFDDNRGSLFFEIIRILKELKKDKKMPKIVFLENVKNILTHDNGETYKKIESELSSIGYKVVKKILNTYEYGNIPQNRERLFIIGFKNQKLLNNFEWPNPITLSSKIDEFVDWKSNLPKKYYYTKENKIFDLLEKNIDNDNLIYQFRRVYVRKNKSGLSPTLTANMGMGGHNVPIIRDYKKRIRKITPRETLKLQGFPEDFIIPSGMVDSQIYKQAGNSVSVTVIKRLAQSIKKTLNRYDNINN